MDNNVNRNCGSWYSCNNGFYSEGTCPANQNYRLDTGACSSTFPYSATDSNSVAFTCKDSRCYGLVDNNYKGDNYCKQYKTCSGGIQTALTACPSGQLFEPVDKTCQVYSQTNGKHASCTSKCSHIVCIYTLRQRKPLSPHCYYKY